MVERRKRRRAMHSCIECHRRKQKCDRGFPCGNCVGRRAHEKCGYTNPPSGYASLWPEAGPHPDREKEPWTTDAAMSSGSDAATLQAGNDSESPNGSKGSDDSSGLMWSQWSPETGRMPESDEPRTRCSTTTLTQLDVGSLGYSKNSIANTLALLKKVESHHGAIVAKHDRSIVSDRDKDLNSKYRSLIRQLPARPYCEILVTLFFEAVNWHYGVLDKQIFLDTYETWWQQGYGMLTAGSPRSLPDDLQLFPALLFQVLAQALQFLPLDYDRSLQHLKMGASQSFNELSEEYSDCGIAITAAIGRENATLVCVQQDFLRASWLKNAGRVAEAWHSLGQAIRAAQEIGIHRNPQASQSDTVQGTIENLWNIELCKRVLINLLIWDGHMSLVLDRPMTINLRDCQVSPPVDCVMPKTRNERIPTAQYSVPTAFTARLLEYQLAVRIPEILSLHASGKYPAGQDYNTLEQLHQFAAHFQKTLPATHRFDNPDTSWDTEYPCLPAQRELLVCHTNAFLLGLHRPYILLSEIDQERAVSAALAILDSQKRLFHQFGVQHYKLYSLSFFTFDGAVMLSTVLISRPQKYADIYPRALQSLSDAVDRLQIIAERISLAKTGAAVIHALISRIKLVRGKVDANATATATARKPTNATTSVDDSTIVDSRSRLAIASGWPSQEDSEVAVPPSLCNESERPAGWLHRWQEGISPNHHSYHLAAYPPNNDVEVDIATHTPSFEGGRFLGAHVPIPTRDLATADLTASLAGGDESATWSSFRDGDGLRLGDQDFHFEGDFGEDSFWRRMNREFL